MCYMLNHSNKYFYILLHNKTSAKCFLSMPWGQMITSVHVFNPFSFITNPHNQYASELISSNSVNLFKLFSYITNTHKSQPISISVGEW